VKQAQPLQPTLTSEWRICDIYQGPDALSHYMITATLNEFFMLWRVRKKVSIPLKAPEAPLFEYVN
jgi:hypothetical protein